MCAREISSIDIKLDAALIILELSLSPWLPHVVGTHCVYLFVDVRCTAMMWMLAWRP